MVNPFAAFQLYSREKLWPHAEGDTHAHTPDTHTHTHAQTHTHIHTHTHKAAALVNIA